MFDVLSKAVWSARWAHNNPFHSEPEKALTEGERPKGRWFKSSSRYSMSPELITVIIATMLPVAELRGGIPLGLGLGLDPATVIVTAFIVNCLVFFPIYFGLALTYDRFFSRFVWARKLIERVHRKGEHYVEKYGILGLAIFVGIPLPVTGAWTGTGAAWLLGLDWKKSFIAICLGVLIATIIVSTISLGVIEGIRLASV